VTGDPWVAEVIDLHVFFARWLGGSADPSEFARLESALADEFVIIGPHGSVVARPALIDQLRAAHGVRPGLEIRIDRPEVVVRSGDVIVGTYEEWQRTAVDEWRGRQSTAVMRDDQGILRWALVHETWMPDDRP